MKNLKNITIALLVAFSTVSVSAQTKTINVEKTKITWLGKILPMGSFYLR